MTKHFFVNFQHQIENFFFGNYPFKNWNDLSVDCLILSPQEQGLPGLAGEEHLDEVGEDFFEKALEGDGLHGDGVGDGMEGLDFSELFGGFGDNQMNSPTGSPKGGDPMRPMSPSSALKRAGVQMAVKVTHRTLIWLIGWLIGFFEYGLIDWLIDWLVFRVWIGWLIGWLIGFSSMDWLVDWLVFRVWIDWLIDWLIDRLKTMLFFVQGIDPLTDEPGQLLQQPLAVGYLVSTARIGPMPAWFFTTTDQDENSCPIVLKVLYYTFSSLRQFLLSSSVQPTILSLLCPSLRSPPCTSTVPTFFTGRKCSPTTAVLPIPWIPVSPQTFWSKTLRFLLSIK